MDPNFTYMSASPVPPDMTTWSCVCPAGTVILKFVQLPEAPLQKYSSDLQWDTSLGMRTRP